jgi:hypothetical protein
MKLKKVKKKVISLMIFQMKIPYFIKYGNIPDIKYYDIDIETYKALSVTHNKSD